MQENTAVFLIFSLSATFSNGMLFQWNFLRFSRSGVDKGKGREAFSNGISYAFPVVVFPMG